MICSRVRRSRAFSCCCICATRALRSWLTCFLGTCDRPVGRVVFRGGRPPGGPLARETGASVRGLPPRTGAVGAVVQTGRVTSEPDPTPRGPEEAHPAPEEASRAPGAPHRRVWRSAREVALMATLGILRRGAGDPTFRRDPDGTVWRGVRTPEGPASLRLVVRADLASVVATAWGPGAEWVLASVPSMLGAADDDSGFVAHHPQVAVAARRFPGWRVPRTGLVLEALVPAILEQKVTGQEAFGSLPHAGAPLRRAGSRRGRCARGCGCRRTPRPGPGSRPGSGSSPAWTAPGRRPSCAPPPRRDAWRR